jgi:hypothetical protein
MCSHASFLFLCTQAEGLEEHNGHLAGQVEGLMEDYEALKEFTTVRVAQEIPIFTTSTVRNSATVGGLSPSRHARFREPSYVTPSHVRSLKSVAPSSPSPLTLATWLLHRCVPIPSALVV